MDFIRKITVFLILLVLVQEIPVQAHSELEKTFPQSGQTLDKSPIQLELWFEDPVELITGSISVIDQQGHQVSGKASVNTKNKRQVTFLFDQQLLTGRYTVNVDVISVDAHRIKESFGFDVKLPLLTAEELWNKLKIEKSSPSDGEVISYSPEKIDLWFTEPTTLEIVAVFNDQDKLVQTNEPYVDPKNRKHMIIELSEDLRKGTYRVFWSALIKGEKGQLLAKEGAFFFAVQEVTSFSPSGGTKNYHFIQSLGVKQLAIWGTFVGLLTLSGGVFFQHFLARGEGNVVRWRLAERILYGVALIGFVLMLVSYWTGLNDDRSISYSDFFRLQHVWVTIIQLMLLTVAYWFFKGYLRIFLLALTVLLWSFVGHSALPQYGGFLGLVLDALHLVSVAIWMGGLLALLVMMPAENSLAWFANQGKAYSKWALASILVLVVTGVWMTGLYVPSFTWDSLLISNWGMTLITKVGLVIVIVIYGFLQRVTIQRVLKTKIIPFIWRARLELAVGLCILLVASMLIDFSPRAALQAVYPNMITQQGMQVSVHITPLKIGKNDIIIEFQNESKLKEVRAEFIMEPDYRAENRAFSMGNGVYKLTGNFLHGAGTIQLNVKAVTMEDKELLFPFEIQVPGEMQRN